MPPRGRKPRTAPLIPTEGVQHVVSTAMIPPPADGPPPPPSAPAPICGQCWPDGWPEGGEHASCIHGDWSKNGPARPAVTAGVPGSAAGIGDDWHAYLPGAAIEGTTTDGAPVIVTLPMRPGDPALVEIKEVSFEDGVRDLIAHAREVAARTGETPVIDMTPPVALSPFKPKVAPLPVDLGEDIDTGEDVMYMPNGG